MDGLGNVPRNGKKFKNFVRNSLRMRSEPTIDQLWDHLEARQQAARATMEKEKEDEKAAGGGIEPKTDTSATTAASTVAAAEGSQAAASGEAVAEKKSKKRPRNSEGAVAEQGAGKKKGRIKDALPVGDSSSQAATDGTGAKWCKIITQTLKSAPDRTLRVKELRRKVVQGFTGSGLKATFDAEFQKAAAAGKVTLDGKNATYKKKPKKRAKGQ